MHVYCLFCETQRCKAIAEYINKTFGYQCISPIIIQRKWIKGEMKEEVHDWLPGYIFLYSDSKLQQHIQTNGIIRWLGKDELIGRDLVGSQFNI